MTRIGPRHRSSSRHPPHRRDHPGAGFYPTKNLHAIESGMIITADAALARTLRLLRDQGMATRYAPKIVSTNAALGLRVPDCRYLYWARTTMMITVPSG